jgi:hypothetical protein
MPEKLNIEDNEEVKPEDKAKVAKGLNAAQAAVSADKAAVKLTGGDRPMDEVIEKSKGDLIKIKQIINQGGYSGPERDKYIMSLHHAEWVQARIEDEMCDSNVEKKSIEYTALVRGKAQSHEIIRAHKDWEDMREKCKKTSNILKEKAIQYVETDRRVRENKAADGDIYPPIGSSKQGFQVLQEGFGGGEEETIREGFEFYDKTTLADNTLIGTVPNQEPRYNVRLPLLNDESSNRATAGGKTTLPWNEYYVVCSDQNPQLQETCKLAVGKKNEYISGINSHFERANRLLNTYYNVSNKSDNQSKLTLLEEADIQAILENQKKNIALHKQNALYDYDEYNSLAFYEDMVIFLYYALFAMFVFISIRDFYTGASFDYIKIATVIFLGIYPKIILPAILWLLNMLTKVTEMLGIKNVTFWK